MKNIIQRPRRGEIWLIDFEPVEGHEQGKARPAVIITSNEVDIMTTEMVSVVPCTKTPKYDPRTGQLLRDVVKVEPTASNGLTETSFFLCGQERSVSLARFLRDSPKGRLTDDDMYEIEEILIFMLDLGAKD